MRVLHVGMLSPHVHQFQRLLTRFGPPGLEQEHVLPEQGPLREPDLVVLHGLNFWPEEALKWEQPVVGLLWNDRWKHDGNRELVEQALERCALIVAPDQSVVAGLPNWFPRWTLVDLEAFYPAGVTEVQRGALWVARSSDQVVDIPYLAARNHRKDRVNLYWTEELRATRLPLTEVSGDLGPEEMGDLMRRSRVVLALCSAEWGPSNTAVEACLCGKVPVLSNAPQIRVHFEEDGQVVGARFADQRPASILAAVREVEQMSPRQHQAEAERNLEYFRSWTIQGQGPELARAVLSQAPQGRLLTARSIPVATS